MRASQPSLEDLRGEMADLAVRFPGLSEDALFVCWFLQAYLIDDETTAAKSLAGVSNDKGVDAVYIDEKGRTVFVVQGKFRKAVAKKAEARADVVSFADLGPTLWGEKSEFAALCQGLDPLVRAKLEEARERLHRRSYGLQLFYVTLGRCSPGLESEARRMAQRANGATEFIVMDGKQVLSVLADYLDGVAPPVRSLDLRVETGGKIRSSGAVSRFDPTSSIESWVFSMSGGDVADLFEKTGVRLFARNIRGFLGATEINRAMEETLRRQPEYFWYFNNGVTVVCDSAQKIQEKGRELLRVGNPQVINGQQTTRVLHAMDQFAPKASVLVRVIRVPRPDDGGKDGFDVLVSRIVEATNWQNFIRASDLVSNDRRQVLIERELRKAGYQYLRKRQTKREARRSVLSHYRFLVKKEELAQAVAACKLDPVVVREGKERLFEERYYTTIFDSSQADHYLTRYWLMKRVSRRAWGFPERAYAKWIVLHFLWERVGREIERRSTRFIKANERAAAHPALLTAMDRSIDAVYGSALAFFRANRGGKGPRALDVSTFFKRRDLHKQFASFWEQPDNRFVGSFRRASERLVLELSREGS